MVSGLVYNGRKSAAVSSARQKYRQYDQNREQSGGGGSNITSLRGMPPEAKRFSARSLDANTVIEHDRTQKIGNDSTDTIGHDLSSVMP